MKVYRRGGAAQLRLDGTEAALLGQLLDDFTAAVGEEQLAAGDAVRARLFPSGYQQDDEAAAEFRSLTEATLRDERCERARQCRAELASGAVQLRLDAEAGERWLRVLNDLRLVLGTRLEVSEDDDGRFDPSAPDAQPRSVYLWLTAVQDSLVNALMG